MEIVELRIGVVVVAAVADGVHVGYVCGRRDGRAAAVGDREHPAPGVVGVLHRQLARRVHQRHDVALEVPHVVILSLAAPVLIPDRVRRTRLVVQELHLRRAVLRLEALEDQPVFRRASRRISRSIATLLVKEELSVIRRQKMNTYQVEFWRMRHL